MIQPAHRTGNILRYVIEWVLIIIAAAAGGVLYYITGWHRPFSLADDAIAFPDKGDIITLPVLVIISFIVPIVVIILSCVAPKISGRSSSSWIDTIQSAHLAVLGLCFSLAITLFFTSGLKDVLTRYTVGGLGTTLDSEAWVLVRAEICKQPDKRLLDDAFAAFPSGHSSFSSAGLVFLSLWICAKLCIPVPFIRHMRIEKPGRASWHVALALIPIGAAAFICASRYADFHHAGVDIVAGSALGSAIAFLSFSLHIRMTATIARKGSGLRGHVTPVQNDGRAHVYPARPLRGSPEDIELAERDGRATRSDTGDSALPMVNSRRW